MAWYDKTGGRRGADRYGGGAGSQFSAPTAPPAAPTPIPPTPQPQMPQPMQSSSLPTWPTPQIVQPGGGTNWQTISGGTNFGSQQSSGPQITPTQKAWNDWLSQDPFYSQFTGQISAQGIADASERDRLIQQALIQFGEIPEGFTSPAITDLTRSLAQEATSSGISMSARLTKAAADARRDSMKGLAARGMLRSGETGYQLGELGLASNQAQYDARQNLLNFLHGQNYAFTQSELGRRLAQIQAEFEAAGRGAQAGIGPLVAGYGKDTGADAARRAHYAQLAYDSEVQNYQNWTNVKNQGAYGYYDDAGNFIPGYKIPEGEEQVYAPGSWGEDDVFTPTPPPSASLPPGAGAPATGWPADRPPPWPGYYYNPQGQMVPIGT